MGTGKHSVLPQYGQTGLLPAVISKAFLHSAHSKRFIEIGGKSPPDTCFSSSLFSVLSFFSMSVISFLRFVSLFAAIILYDKAPEKATVFCTRLVREAEPYRVPDGKSGAA